jgi:hypothetical protein
MSFGVTQKQLVSSLGKLRKCLCHYMGPGCDCKYMAEDAEGPGRNESSGCPELYEAMDLIAAMTPEEFDLIRKRARIVISEIDFYGTKEGK